MKRKNPFRPTIKKNFSSLTETTAKTTSIETPLFPSFYVTENITETFPRETSFIIRHILGVTDQKSVANVPIKGGLTKGNDYSSTIRTQFAEMFFGMLDDIKKREAIRKNAPQTKVVQEIVPHENVEKNIRDNINLIISDVDRYDLRDSANLALARLVYLKAFIIEFTAKILKWHKIFSEIKRRDGDNNKTFIDVDYKEEFKLLLDKLESQIKIQLINDTNASINNAISVLKEQLINKIDENIEMWEGEKGYADSIKYYNKLKNVIQNTASTGMLLTQPMISFLESKQEKEIKNILNVGRIRLGANFSENSEDVDNSDEPAQTTDNNLGMEEYNDQSIIVEEFENDFFLQNDFFTTGLMLVNSITSEGEVAKSAIGALICLFYLLTPESGLSDVYVREHGEDRYAYTNPTNVVTRGLGRLKIGGKDMDVTVSKVIRRQIED